MFAAPAQGASADAPLKIHVAGMSALSYRLLLNRRGFAFMGLNGAVLAALLQACAPQVAPETMMAVIRVASAGDPFRIGVNKGGPLRRQPGNAPGATAPAKKLGSA